MLLENECLSFYETDDTSTSPLDRFELCPVSSSASVGLISDIKYVTPCHLMTVSVYMYDKYIHTHILAHQMSAALESTGWLTISDSFIKMLLFCEEVNHKKKSEQLSR